MYVHCRKEYQHEPTPVAVVRTASPVPAPARRTVSQHSADVRQMPLYKTAEGVSSLDFDQFQPVTSRSVFGRRQGVVAQEEEEEKRGRKKVKMHLKKINTRSAENSRSLKEVEEEEDGLFVQQQQQQQQQLTPEPLSNHIELVDRYDPHFFHEQQ